MAPLAQRELQPAELSGHGSRERVRGRLDICPGILSIEPRSLRIQVYNYLANLHLRTKEIDAGAGERIDLAKSVEILGADVPGFEPRGLLRREAETGLARRLVAGVRAARILGHPLPEFPH